VNVAYSSSLPTPFVGKFALLATARVDGAVTFPLLPRGSTPDLFCSVVRPMAAAVVCYARLCVRISRRRAFLVPVPTLPTCPHPHHRYASTALPAHHRCRTGRLGLVPAAPGRRGGMDQYGVISTGPPHPQPPTSLPWDSSHTGRCGRHCSLTYLRRRA